MTVNHSDSAGGPWYSSGRKLIVVAVVALLIGIGLWKFWFSPAPLPNSSDIKSMQAQFDDWELRKHFDFDVPTTHWAEIIEALKPSRPDRSGADWKMLGTIQIEKNDGLAVTIHLFETPEGPGAFEIDRSTDDRDTYRGGSTKDLKEALQRAYEASIPP